MKALTLEQFLDRLASADPTPGGGSAAALAGATAAALVAMVARISQGKGPADALAAMVERAERSRSALTALIADDALAFEAVRAAWRLPRDSEEAQAARRAAVQEALRGATEVPLRVAREALAALELTPELARTGTASALSDVAAAALLGYAAVNGALYNARINLKGITDQAYVAETATEVDRLNRASAAPRDAAMAAVRERL